MSKTLIIGKGGTLGSEFMRLLGDEAIGVDRNKLDITNQEAVNKYISELKPKLIVNCAAFNAVDKAEENPDAANMINGTAVGYIAVAAQSVDATLVHYSSNYVFKGDNPNGYKEDDPTDPQSKYGNSKLRGEKEALQKCKNTYLVRTAWLYGKQGSGPSTKVNYVDRIQQLVKEKDTLEGVSDQYGQPTWTYDLARFTMNLVRDQKPFGIYHGTNSGQASWYTWAQEIFKIKGFTNELKENHMSNFASSGHVAPRPQHGLLLCTKTESMRPWQEALQEYLTTN